MMHTMDDAVFEQVAKVLADPRRFEILRIVAARPDQACCDIVEQVPLTQPTVSHHLKELARVGLVAARRHGPFTRFSTCPAVIESYLDELRRRLALQQTA